MPDLSEHHEVRVRGKNASIIFFADSDDGRMGTRQERDGKGPREVCAITLTDSDELRAFFKGLRRILASSGHPVTSGEGPVEPRRRPRQALSAARTADREAVVAQARPRNPQAFTPWTRQEEEKVGKRHREGESIQAIARAHEQSPRAIELRLQRLGLVPEPDGMSSGADRLLKGESLPGASNFRESLGR